MTLETESLMPCRSTRASRCRMRSVESTSQDGTLALLLSRSTRSLTQFCRDVTHHLQLLLRKSGSNLSTSAEMETVRTIKERMCYVAMNPGKEDREIMAAANNSSSAAATKGAAEADNAPKENEFVLPDGKKIKVRRFLPLPFHHV